MSRKTSSETERMIINDYQKGETIKQITHNHEVSSVTVYNILRRNAISIRGGRLLSQEQFIVKAREKHGDKFFYDRVKYKNYNTKVLIGCRKHGYFMQEPDSHISGRGCPNCNPHKKDTVKTFVAKARNKHGNKYDYSKVTYHNAKIKVTIICYSHGSFRQLPGDHLDGHGCKKCMAESIRLQRVTPLSVFIEKARVKHGEKYDYSLVEIFNSGTEVEIICDKHGSFWQTPTTHYRSGCPDCALIYMGQVLAKRNKANGQRLGRLRAKSKELFIEQAKVKHGEKYNYSLIEYFNTETKVEIICDEHGSFWQTPHTHLSGKSGRGGRGGSGCPECADKLVAEILKERNKGWLRDHNLGWNDCDDFAEGMRALLDDIK